MSDTEKKTDELITEKLTLLLLERDDTLYILRNANINEISSQAKYYEEILNEVRELQRKSKRDKVSEGQPLADIQQWDKQVRDLKQSEEDLYHEMTKVIDEY